MSRVYGKRHVQKYFNSVTVAHAIDLIELLQHQFRQIDDIMVSHSSSCFSNLLSQTMIWNDYSQISKAEKTTGNMLNYLERGKFSNSTFPKKNGLGKSWVFNLMDPNFPKPDLVSPPQLPTFPPSTQLPLQWFSLWDRFLWWFHQLFFKP